MGAGDRAGEAERREATPEAEMARLEREAGHLHRAYVAAQQAFEQRRDAPMEAIAGRPVTGAGRRLGHSRGRAQQGAD